MDIKQPQWSAPLLRELGLDTAKFPEIHNSSEICGPLSREASRALGLPEGIPVVYGGGDAACATRGAGVRDLSSAYIGSSAWISTLAPGPVENPKKRTQNFFDLDPRKCNVCGIVQNAGIAVDWAHSLVAETLDYGIMDTEVAAVPPGSRGVLFAPYLMGERTSHWDANARGSFVVLSLHHTRSALLRSVYEGVAFALKDVLNMYADLGIQPEHLTLLGGGSKSRVWRSIFSDVFALPSTPHSAPTNATSLGAAMAAAVGTGLYADLDSATLMAHVLPTETPSPGGELKRTNNSTRYIENYTKPCDRSLTIWPICEIRRNTMKAAVIEKPGTIVVKEVADPQVSDYDVLIRVMASGICGTDIHIFKGEYLGTYPVIPGHEFSGVVEQVGPKVHRIKVGDRVLIIGAGLIGILLSKTIQLQGSAEITKIDKNQSRRELAKKSGAARTESSFDALKMYDYDVVVDATGVPPLMEKTSPTSAPAERFSFSVYPPQGAKINLEAFTIFSHGLTILSSYTSVRIDVKPLVSHVIPLKDFQRA